METRWTLVYADSLEEEETKLKNLVSNMQIQESGE